MTQKDHKQKRSTEGIFEIQKSGDKTSSGEIGLDIRTHASPKVGQDQVSGGVSVPCTSFGIKSAIFTCCSPCLELSCLTGNTIRNARNILQI